MVYGTGEKQMTDNATQVQALDHQTKDHAKDQIGTLINSLNAADWQAASPLSLARGSAATVGGEQLVLHELPKGTADTSKQSVVIVDEGAHKTHVLQMQDGQLRDVLTVPDSVGKPSTPTPVQRWEVSDKRLDPVWYPPASIGGHPIEPYKQNHHNPIGLAFIRLDGTGFGLHGTNRPDQIGKSVSHGCMRHNNEDILKIYPLVQKGTAVYTVKHFDGAVISGNDFNKR